MIREGLILAAGRLDLSYGSNVFRATGRFDSCYGET